MSATENSSPTPACSPDGRDPAPSLLVRAARGEQVAHPPVWFMRQAGRSLPEYRALRVGTGMLESCRTPDLVTEITLQPVRRHGVDAAIFFSDIVVPLQAAGIDIEIVAGVGPVVASPVRSAADVEAMPRLSAEQIPDITESVQRLVCELDGVPLIGFAGAPYTLASYLIEGGPSKDHARTKALMHSDPATWHRLLSTLADISATFLLTQLAAGASAVQLFDSWAGGLSEADYRAFVLPHSQDVFAAIADYDVPKIHFGVGTGELLAAMRDAGASVVGVDWRTPLDEAARRIGGTVAVQGNLDPALLFADWHVVEREVRRIVSEGRRAPGHIFNLGHGVLPDTDPEMLTRVVELVHSL
ncbi:uroporphyrinogen decarboxylase [Jatrophihabitans telluris]|uniref:Uroporphyrinogen decarboxylase n=1 Tax=Jatrophihabitans telluris TaxID=2038343 RepID=A0ABY4QS00_9ACTN|nr:uroporphyrinogen decarboxylase [Jatrophihabitans telluris]UQX86688.1 uroporphyrinogen decarboxylase [Jatrophihabitans telluris]